MKFSAQEEYGLRCLVAIARRGDNGTMTIPELAMSEGLSQPHIGKLMAILRKSGYVKSTRGQIGGYSLARRPSEIILGEVLADLGGKLFYEGFCDRHSGTLVSCVHLDGCNLRGLWSKVQTAVDEVVSKITLQNVLDEAPGSFATIEESPSRRPLQVTQ